MSTIKNILVPTDFSATANLAIAHGANMAKVFDAKVFLLHSVETFVYMGAPGEPALVQESEKIFTAAVAQLNKAADDMANQYGLSVTPITATGKPAPYLKQ
jgi:nucleotide-binding universal stress UspA family protein